MWWRNILQPFIRKIFILWGTLLVRTFQIHFHISQNHQSFITVVVSVKCYVVMTTNTGQSTKGNVLHLESMVAIKSYQVLRTLINLYKGSYKDREQRRYTNGAIVRDIKHACFAFNSLRPRTTFSMRATITSQLSLEYALEDIFIRDNDEEEQQLLLFYVLCGSSARNIIKRSISTIYRIKNATWNIKDTYHIPHVFLSSNCTDIR